MRRRAVIFGDNDLIRGTLWFFFDQRGYEVFSFPELGLCPLHVAQQCPCPEGTSCADLIISDVNMMEANGIGYIETLIGKGCKQRHFALISGSFSETDLGRAAKIGCTPFTKPPDLAAIQAWVESVEKRISRERVLYEASYPRETLETVPDKPSPSIADLKSVLDSDPANIEAANRYWEALGSADGHDVRSGRFAIEAFRGCALASTLGVIALCRAFCGLFEKSGEHPPPELFDEELLHALRIRLPELSIYDTSLVLWILRASGKSPWKLHPFL